MQLTMQELEQLLAIQQGRDATGVGQKITTANTANLTANLMYGRGGMFGACVDTQIVNASVQDTGIAGWLTWKPSKSERHQVGLITYMGHDPDSEPNLSEPCYDPPTPKFQGCTVSYCFGDLRAASPQYNLLTQGLRYCEQTPVFRLFGAYTDQFGNVIGPQGGVIDSDLEWGMIMAGVQADQDLCDMMWIGDPANPTISFSEFKGLMNYIVQTGYYDEPLGVRCPAVDSEVKDFGNDCVCDYQATRVILDYMLAVKRGIDDRRRRAKMPPINWERDAAWVGPRQLLEAIWDCIPCQVPSVCAGVVQQQAGAVNAASITYDGQAKIRETEELRSRRIFRIDGEDIPAIVDDCAPITYQGAREFGSLFLLVKKVGPMDILYGEFVDLRTTVGQILTEVGAVDKKYLISDGGRWLSWIESKNECMDVRLAGKVRLVCTAPQLQGRIDNVCWEPLQHTIESDPDSEYSLFGGVQDVQPPALYYGCFEDLYGSLPTAGG